MSIDQSATRLYKAMKGLGTNEKEIISVLTSHSNLERQELKKRYLSQYGHNLVDDLKSEISGHFLETTLAYLEPTIEYEAECLRKAIKGLGTDEDVLIELLCSKDGQEIKELAAAYNKRFNRNMLEDVQGEQGGDLGRLFTSLASGNRDSSNNVDKQAANADAKDLYKAGEGKLGTDEVEFVRILCSRNFAQLREVFNEYFKVARKDIEASIKGEMSGKLEKAFLAIVKSIRNKPAYFAERIYLAMKGLGTDDRCLIRNLVARSERDLQAIKREYNRMYSKELVAAVKDDVSGDYERLLVAIIN